MFKYLIAILIVAPAMAQMQSARGVIQGTVLDGSGSALAGTRVTVTQLDTGLVRETSSDGEGNFRFAALQVGAYQLRLEHEGFGTTVIKELNVSVGQTVVQRIDMCLCIWQFDAHCIDPQMSRA